MQNKLRNFGKRWTINECLQLQREFELLGLSIKEIAQRHGRSESAIMYKLDQEGFADYNVLYSNHYNLNSHIPVSRTSKHNVDYSEEEDSEEEDDEEEDSEEEDDDEETSELDELRKHVMRLEKQVSGLTEIFTKQNKNNKSVFSLFA
jgi:TATA-binding protein-associated factor Taf7